MLRFFRQIRQHSLTEFKFGKYLLYAVGEILLIVTGILLALHLDNMNAEKQARAAENELLKELRSNLQSNIGIITRSLDSELEYLSYNEMILDYLDNRKPYDQSLDRAFGVYFWTISTNPVKGGYDFLKSKGIDIITNDRLRNNISLIFENEFPILKNENEVWSNNLQQSISYPYHVEHFRRYYPVGANTGEELARPFDYNSLLDDDQFKSINAEIISNRKWNINSLKELRDEIEDLILLIDAELSS